MREQIEIKTEGLCFSIKGAISNSSKLPYLQVFSQGLGGTAKDRFRENEGRNIEDDFFFQKNLLIYFTCYLSPNPFKFVLAYILVVNKVQAI